MAFCPHCGKSVTEQASKCLACGQEFEPRAKGARFKGTMMMSPGAAGAAQPPGSANAAKPPAPKPADAAKPATAAAAPPARLPTPAPSKVGKATMLGTGGAGLAPPASRASAQSAEPAGAKPPPAAGTPARATAPAAPSPPKAPEPDRALAQTARLRTEPELDAPSTPSEPEDSQRFLVGDPMAPAPTGRTRKGSHGSSPEGVLPPKASALIAIGIAGVLVIAGVGYATAKYLGLLN